MKILICPDKFKGSLSAEDVCQSLQQGLLSSNQNLQINLHPMADGGDGSVDIIKNKLQLQSKKIISVDPLGREINTEYFYKDDSAFIELASASGIVLLEKSERNPLVTSTRGTGIQMKDAIQNGFKKIYLFIGGSATSDGGIGLSQSLGFNFLDKQGHQLDPVGHNLLKIHSIENKSNFDFSQISIKVLCDVTNPMHGLDGAAHIYGPQKGADPWAVKLLDDGLKNYAKILHSLIDKDLSNDPGMGAAGAVGASLVGLLQAELQNGFKMLAEVTDLEKGIQKADLVITGEGKIDSSSFQGKVVGNVLSLCEKYSIPCGIVGGMIQLKEFENFIFQKSIISRAVDINDAMTNPKKYLIEIGKEIKLF